MNKTAFGRTGLQVTRLGYGAAEVGYLKVEQQAAARILNFMLDSGVNLIDTAASYLGSEELIGSAIAHRRAEYVLVSKCGRSIPESSASEWSAELIRASVDRSLARLRTEHLDAMLLHSCDLETLKKGEAIGALVDARKAGKIRHVGYSGDNQAAAYAAAHPDVAVIETSISIADQANIDLVLPVAREHNVGVLAKRPIANAAWKDVAQQPGFYGSYAAPYYDRLRRMNLDPARLGFPGKPDEAWPELALRFTLSQPGVHSAIIGTTKTENAERNIAAAQKGPLPRDVVETIREAFKYAEAAAGATWLGET